MCPFCPCGLLVIGIVATTIRKLLRREREMMQHPRFSFQIWFPA